MLLNKRCKYYEKVVYYYGWVKFLYLIVYHISVGSVWIILILRLELKLLNLVADKNIYSSHNRATCGLYYKAGWGGNFWLRNGPALFFLVGFLIPRDLLKYQCRRLSSSG